MNLQWRVVVREADGKCNELVVHAPTTDAAERSALALKPGSTVLLIQYQNTRNPS